MTIPASLNLADAIVRTWDVIVVGAGPAGSVAARELARAGVSVLLVDKANFPRAKVCGGCINLRALSVLADAGLGDCLKLTGAVPLGQIQLAAQLRAVTIPLPGGIAISRERFDAVLLLKALEAGVSFLPQTEARLEYLASDHRVLSLRQAGDAVSVATRVILVADGLSSGTLQQEKGLHRHIQNTSRLGAGVVLSDAPQEYLPGTIYMACGSGGYVGAVRVEYGKLNVAAALDAEGIKQHGGLGQTAHLILQEAGLPPIPHLTKQPWRGTPLLTRNLTRPFAERVFVLGDAAGYVEPFTGEGIAWALASATAVAPLALQATQKWHPDLGRKWTTLQQSLVGRRQYVIRAAAKILRHPWLTQTLLALLGPFPILARPVVRFLNHP